MQYFDNDKLNAHISRLGFGIMRLPMNEDGSILENNISLIRDIYKNGCNYFDTGYEYLKGRSRETRGRSSCRPVS